MKKNKIKLFAIGHAHIDPVWLWDWQEGCSEVISTFKSAVERIKEYPDFVFTAGSAIHYKWVEEFDPELIKEIKKYVRLGNWSIVNGWMVQPDCNIPSGESFVRQALYGKKYFKEKFGIDVTVGYNPDSFGHNGSLPQILKKCGFKYYIFFRPDKREKPLSDIIFKWKSQDGSYILGYQAAFKEGDFYGTSPGDIKDSINGLGEVIKGWKLPCGMFFYGVGDHGGGPTKKNIESIIEYQKNENEFEIKFGTIEEFFKNIIKEKKDIFTLQDELQHHAVGCYTSNSQIKTLNRKSENEIYVAETLGAIGFKFLGLKYPVKEINTAWENILFNQFHDILAGSAISKAYQHARDGYGLVLHISRNIINSFLRKIIRKTSKEIKIDIKGKEEIFGTISIFNPLSWRRNEYIKLHLVPYDWNIRDFKIKDIQGKPVEIQQVPGESRMRTEILGYFENLPACGIKTYIWEISPRKEEEKTNNEMLISPQFLENRFWKIKINQETGYISSIYDKINKVEILKSDSNIPVLCEDTSDTWGHDLQGFPNEIGSFKKKRIDIEEKGPLRGILKITSVYNNSTLEQKITIYKHLNFIDFRCRVLWTEKIKFLKIKFEPALTDTRVFSSIPYGYIERKEKNGMEEPCQSWIDIAGKIENENKESINYAFAFINDSKYGYDVNDKTVRLSIIRSPLYAYWHKGPVPDEHMTYEFMDQGESYFNYRIYPRVINEKKYPSITAQEFNIPPEIIYSTFQGGRDKLKVTPEISFIEIKPPSIILTALKKCEYDNDLIVRVVETEGKDTKAELNLGFLNKKLKFKIKHNEIKTLKLSFKKNKIILKEKNLLEI